MNDAPRTVLAVVPDLMDRSRMAGAAEVDLQFLAAGELGNAISNAEADLIVVDLNRAGVLEIIAGCGNRRIPIVGFGPHVDDDLLAGAAAAGVDLVLPRSRFFARWPHGPWDDQPRDPERAAP